MIFDRLTIFRTLFPTRDAAGPVALRWTQAAGRSPELIEDVIRMGGVLAKAPARYVEGVEAVDPIDPIRLARDQGRREMALELLALMTINGAQLADLLEQP